MTCQKISKKKDKNTFVVSEACHPRDLEVIKTLSIETGIEIHIVPLDQNTGLTDLAELKKAFETNPNIFGLCFPQVTCFGNIEDVDEITDLAKEYDIKTVAVIDPILLTNNGLKKPSQYGQHAEGVDIIVGEAQHLALRQTLEVQG